MNALQLVLEELPIDHEDRVRIVVQTLADHFLPKLADQACLEIHDLQTALGIEIAFRAGSVLEPLSALHFSSLLVESVSAGATSDHDNQVTDDASVENDITSLH